jgi:hypothetical protein
MYSRYHNKRYVLDGHAFDGPYQAFRQATELLMLHTIAYVLYNPVKGGICQNPEDYPWSSAGSYLEGPLKPSLVNPIPLMTSIHPDPKKAWSRFHEAMAQEARRPSKQSLARPTMSELHQKQFEWLLDHARRSVEQLGTEDPTIVAMHWARQVGVTPKAMAKVLGLNSTSPIRDALYRFNRRLRLEPGLQTKVELC